MEKILNALNINEYFSFLFHAVTYIKVETTFERFIFHFICFNIILKKGRETFAVPFSTSAM